MIELGLQRISRLLSKAPLPWKAVHVAGTNGKGSVCTYVSDMLNTYNRSKWRQRSGHAMLRHGRFTSPHLINRWDCISLSNEDEMKTVPKALFHDVEESVQSINKQHHIEASEFELLTATAFTIFTRSSLDLAVVETGMGGRLDATNILGQISTDHVNREGIDMATFRPRPLVTAITKIGLDHQAFLGDTIEAIAREKAGIMKPGVPVLYDRTNQPSVRQVLKESAQAMGFSRAMLDAYDPPGNDAPLQNLGPGQEPMHVATNGQLAFEATMYALISLGRISPSANPTPEDQAAHTELMQDLSKAYRQTRVPGRLERINIEVSSGSSKEILLDGAHNAQSAGVLGQYVDAQRKAAQPVTWLLAASDTKDVKEMLQQLLQPGDKVCAVEFGPVDGMPWVKPMAVAQITAAAKQVVPELQHAQECGTDVRGALQSAIAAAGDDGLVVAAGSLYLVGDIHRLQAGDHD
ncbi:putative dihydrofolate synthetase [Fulvia fulva]|uniref:Dihydrofolate synthetase n=1 Tax=Passalora fulva TaxID=5499 RepID=A0A9Q8PLU1_PASFU|nr:putative dihydrofolate synthetase [Fulvia fulva]KAK4610064.1 putative dihydrofolate synthetase [Fulvia fulva]KAK4611174.1 putative dihydrofolate synthetase [Fulvia fulva]UJO24754.1 putative dihydrofolate synthetase [Fulvia fulva]WPV22015.1 putative dihydrofolate synthetase [Fulvia fulva]WPV37302.1 putative dihydrofolate synthetase [Fulvia fulva]